MSNGKGTEAPVVATVSDAAPSAPPIVREDLQTTSDDSTLPAASSDVQLNQARAAPGGAHNPSPYSEPPPSYQMAVGYPTTPYPSGGQPQMPTVPPGYLPKPYPSHPQQPGQPPIYYATHTVGMGQFPQGDGIPVATQVVVAVGNGFTCPHCNVGVVTKETDMCCMLCLILLTIFTFPFGLVFLCCLPCTVSRRCTNCRRTV